MARGTNDVVLILIVTITVSRLFKLTDEDLLHFRILSVGHRKELLVYIKSVLCGVCVYVW